MADSACLACGEETEGPAGWHSLPAAQHTTSDSAMACFCYYILTGHYPRNHEGQDPVKVILDGQIIPIRQRDPFIPVRVAEVIDRSLANKPSDRYPDAGEMHRALAQVL